MCVVEVRRIPIAPEETQIAMWPGFRARLLHVRGQLKIANVHIFQERDTEWAYEGRFIFAATRNSEGVIAFRFDLDDFPHRLGALGVGSLPARKSVLKVFI